MSINFDLPMTKIKADDGGVGANYWEGCGLILFALSDDACVVFSDCSPYGIKQLKVTVVRYDGAYTYYATSLGGFEAYILTIVPFGSGKFLLTNEAGQTFFIQVADLGLNNATPILIKESNLQLSNPCWNQLNQTFFDGTQNLLVASFVEGFEEGADIWSSLYDVSGSNLSLIQTGYVGNAEPNSDPFDRTGSTGISNPNFIATTSLGANIAFANNVGNPSMLEMAYQQIRINRGNSSDCNTPNGTYVYTGSSQLKKVLQSEYPGNTYLCDSNISGLFAIQNNYHNVMLVLGNNGVSFNVSLTGFSASESPTCCAITRKHIFATGRDGTDGKSGAVFVGDTDAFYNGFSLNQFGYSLVNSARPISLNGAFKA